MKKWWVIAYAAILFVIVLAFIFFYHYQPPIDENNKPILNENAPIDERMGKECNYERIVFYYPGASALAYGQYPKYPEEFPCFYVYNQAFDEDNSKICTYLEDDKSRAMCMGTASANLTNLEVCEEFTGENKDICLTNIVLKDYKKNAYNNISSKESAENICMQVNASLFKSICLSYLVKVFNDTSLCNFELVFQSICLKKYLENSTSYRNSGKVSNVTYIDNETGSIMDFINYSEILNQNSIFLRASIKEQLYDNYSLVKFYSCNTIFDNMSNIPLECKEIEMLYCFGFFNGCNIEIPRWEYYGWD
jgi:hypothetical protein